MGKDSGQQVILLSVSKYTDILIHTCYHSDVVGEIYFSYAHLGCINEIKFYYN